MGVANAKSLDYHFFSINFIACRSLGRGYYVFGHVNVTFVLFDLVSVLWLINNWRSLISSPFYSV